MRRETKSMGIIVGLLITLVFASAMLFVLITGARFYQNIAAVMDEQFKERTCLSYIVANVRHYDAAGSVSIGDFNGVDALVLREETEDGVNNTIIYFYEGYIYELYAPVGSASALGDGFQLIQMDEISFEKLSPTLYKIDCSVGGRTDELLFHVSSS